MGERTLAPDQAALLPLAGRDPRRAGRRTGDRRAGGAQPPANGAAVATGEHEVIPCGLLIRSIGRRGRPLPGVPFDERRGLIRSDGGRVCELDGTPRTGEYAV